MGKRSRALSREEILQKMCDLARATSNDPVRLAYLTEEQANEIAKLDLTALTEFKRSPTGAVEIKLTDRLEVLEKVMDLLGGDDRFQGEQFLKALEQQGQEVG